MSVDPQKLQEWAVPVIAGHKNGFEVPIEEVPDFLKKIDGGGPTSAFVSTWSTANGRSLVITWGDGFGHWGIVVGNKDFVMSGDNTFTHVSKWVQGVYFFNQTK